MVIACSDSRADPATIFDTDPGEIFVVRNVANLVPPFETDGGRHGVSAALEFAVTQLKVPEIVVMGHERCGGIAALTGKFHARRAGEGGFVQRWMSQIDDPAGANRAGTWHRRGRAADAGRGRDPPEPGEPAHLPVRRGTRKNGTLKLLGCHFSIRDGELWLLDEAEDAFRPV